VREKSPHTHTLRTQNCFKLTQSLNFRSTFPIEVDTETIISAWYAIVNSVRPSEEILENGDLSLDIRE
jgi:hypothetical protein